MLIDHDLSLWKRLFIQSQFTRTDTIESDVTTQNLLHAAPSIVTKDLFKSYSMTRTSLCNGSFHEEIELPSETRISAPTTFNSRIPTLTFDETNLTLLVWNERTDDVSQYLWHLDESTAQRLRFGLHDRESDLIFKERFVVYSLYCDVIYHEPSFIAVSEIGGNQLKPLWHQESSDVLVQWRVCQAGNKLIRIAKNFATAQATLEFLDIMSGDITNAMDLSTNINDLSEELFSYKDSWVAVSCGMKIILVDVQEEEVKYLGHASGNDQLEFTGKLQIVNDSVYALAHDNTVVIFEASTGNVVQVYRSDIEEPIEGFYVDRERLLLWSKHHLVCHNLDVKSFNENICSTHDLSYTLNNTNKMRITEEVYYDIVEAQIVQNVIVICYTINSILQDTCEIKLAFIPVGTSKTNSMKEVTVSLENSCERPEAVQLLSTATSVAVNTPLSKTMLIYNFWERMC